MFRRVARAVICVLALTSCGGGDDDDPNKDTSLVKQAGRFLDVEGLGFQSGATKGVTGSAGQFLYEATHTDCKSRPVNGCDPTPTIAATTFQLMSDVALPGGGVPQLGTFPTLLDPADDDDSALAPYATWLVSPFSVSDDPVVQRNVELVLAMADADGNPANGVQIPAVVSQGSFGGSVNWSSTDPRSDLAPLQGRIRELDPAAPHNWPADDEQITDHFGLVWNCGLVGRYSATLTEPKFRDTNNIEKKFSGTLQSIVTPTGVLGSLVFGTKPWTFDGFFRISGALARDASVLASTTQFVDDGQFAPLTLNPVDVTTTIQFKGVPRGPEPTTGAQPAGTTGSWSGGGYGGGLVSRATRLEMSSETQIEGSSQKIAQPFTPLYRFIPAPIWIKKPANYGGDEVEEYVWQIEINDTGKVMAGLAQLDSALPVTKPALSDLSAGGALSIALDEKDTTTPYEFRFDGAFDAATITLAGTFVAWDGSGITWDATTPLVGCTTRGSRPERP